MKTLNQTRPTAALILIAGFICSVATVFGQPCKANIKVNSMVGIQQVQPFEVSDSKSTPGMSVSDEKNRKMNAMGAFIIKGKENGNVLVNLNAPEVLTNREKQIMPLNMSLAWHNNTPCAENKLQWNEKRSNTFTFSPVNNGAESTTGQDDQRQGYLYLKGTADVPADSQSPFTGDIKLTIEY